MMPEVWDSENGGPIAAATELTEPHDLVRLPMCLTTDPESREEISECSSGINLVGVLTAYSGVSPSGRFAIQSGARLPPASERASRARWKVSIVHVAGKPTPTNPGRDLQLAAAA